MCLLQGTLKCSLCESFGFLNINCERAKGRKASLHSGQQGPEKEERPVFDAWNRNWSFSHRAIMVMPRCCQRQDFKCRAMPGAGSHTKPPVDGKTWMKLLRMMSNGSLEGEIISFWLEWGTGMSPTVAMWMEEICEINQNRTRSQTPVCHQITLLRLQGTWMEC